MFAVRTYLLLAVILLINKRIQSATGHKHILTGLITSIQERQSRR